MKVVTKIALYESVKGCDCGLKRRAAIDDLARLAHFPTAVSSAQVRDRLGNEIAVVVVHEPKKDDFASDAMNVKLPLMTTVQGERQVIGLAQHQIEQGVCLG